MLTSSTFHAIGGILLCSLTLASSVISSALPAGTQNQPKDCVPKYGYIQIVDPSNPNAATTYIDNGHAQPDYRFRSTNFVVQAGIFKYINCEGFGVADLEVINYPGADDYRFLGLISFNDFESPDAIWTPVTVNHIGGSGPFFLPSSAPIPYTEHLGGSQPFLAESAVWTFGPDGTSLFSQLTTTDYSFITVNAYLDGTNLAFKPSTLSSPPTLKFLPVTAAAGATCFITGWSDQLPCSAGTCQPGPPPVLYSLCQS